ncbi:MAG: LptA/OstA family protein [Oligosphaeraceae bacterium]
MSRLLLCLLLAAALPLAFAQQDSSSEERRAASPSGTVTIAADRMEMTLQHSATLEGNVEVVFLPAGETLQTLQKQIPGEDQRVVLNADQMEVFFQEGSSTPRRIQATGRVRIHTADGKSATGDQGMWELEDGGNAIILEGKCTILADGRVMTSSRIRYDLKENRFEAARAVLTLPVDGREEASPLELVKPAPQEK